MKNRDVKATPVTNYFPNSTWHETPKGQAVLSIKSNELEALRKLKDLGQIKEDVVYSAIHNLVFTPFISPKQLSRTTILHLAVECDCILISKYPIRNSRNFTATSLNYAIQESRIRSYDIVREEVVDAASEKVVVHTAKHSNVGSTEVKGVIVHPSLMDAETVDKVLECLETKKLNLNTVYLSKLSNDSVLISINKFAESSSRYPIHGMIALGIPIDLSRTII